MGKYNIKKYVRDDGIQGTPEDYSTIEMLNNKHNIMIDANTKSFVLVRRSDNGKIICYRLNTSPFMKESKYEFKTYIDNDWSKETYYANHDIPNVGEEIFDVNDGVIGTITEVGNQKIILNNGSVLYRFFGGDISSKVTLTINPTPSDAVVTLTADGYTQNGNSITVPLGTNVDYMVEGKGTSLYAWTNEDGTNIIYTITVPEPSTSGLIIFDSNLQRADLEKTYTAYCFENDDGLCISTSLYDGFYYRNEIKDTMYIDSLYNLYDNSIDITEDTVIDVVLEEKSGIDITFNIEHNGAMAINTPIYNTLDEQVGTITSSTSSFVINSIKIPEGKIYWRDESLCDFNNVYAISNCTTKLIQDNYQYAGCLITITDLSNPIVEFHYENDD